MSLALLLAPAAFAATMALHISGPEHVKAGRAVKLVVSGHTKQKRQLAIFLGSSRCEKGVVNETLDAVFSTKVTKLGQQTVHGKFRQPVRIAHSTVGSHYLCAYLFVAKGSEPGIQASLHYTTK